METTSTLHGLAGRQPSGELGPVAIQLNSFIDYEDVNKSKQKLA